MEAVCAQFDRGYHLTDHRVVTHENSTTFEIEGATLFELQYVGGSTVSGHYMSDAFTVTGSTVDKLIMGLGVESTDSFGIMGIGPKAMEASRFHGIIYPNLPVALEDEGHINTTAYSLWLNDLDANTGSILWGGVDTEKYVGNMTRVNVIPKSEGEDITFLAVALTSLRFTNESDAAEVVSERMPLYALLDSGSTVSYLPADIVESMWEYVGAQEIEVLGEEGEPPVNVGMRPCGSNTDLGTFEFGFGGLDGPRINVPLDEMVLTNSPFTTTNISADQTFSPDELEGPWCPFGVQKQSYLGGQDSAYVLGLTFLRSAYVVYDLVNNEIGLAQTVFNATGTNIVPFESHGAVIPSSTVAANQDGVELAPRPTQSLTVYTDDPTDDSEDDKDNENAASGVKIPTLAVAISVVLLGLFG